MKPETKYVTVEVDGKLYSLPTDKPLLYALLDLGFDVPYFCSHKWLEPLGACRMCMVKMEENGRMYPKLQIACAMYAKEGMKVWLDHPEVLLARKEQLEFHLLNHPLECPVCDKGGECMLQDLTFAHGWDAGRFIEQKRIRPDKAMNDYIRLNYKRCIHCKRCINFTNDIDQTHLLKFITRGADTWIEGYPEEEAAPRFSGNVIDMCPVGALTARSYRFMGRPWEQQLVPSIGSLDSVGANIWLSGRLGEVARIIPRDNPDVENGLIDDVTRFSWESIDDADRLRKASVNGEKTNFAQGCKAAAARFQAVRGEHGPDTIGVIAGSNLNTEEYLALRRLALEVLETQHFHFGEAELGGVDLEVLTGNTGSISQILHAGTVVTIGTDLFEEAPALGLWLDVKARRGELRLINLRTHGSGTDSGAIYIPYAPGELQRTVEADLLPLLAEFGDDCAILCGLDELPASLALREKLAAGGKPVWLNPVYEGANSAGALLVNNLEQFADTVLLSSDKRATSSLGKILQAAADGKVKALLIVDADILNTYKDRSLVERALQSAEVIYCGPFAVPTAGHASVVLPFGTWAHKEGTIVNLEWRVQKRLPGQIDSVAPTALDLANQLASALGQAFIAAELGELYLQLGERVANWPLASFAGYPEAGLLFRPQVKPGDTSAEARDLAENTSAATTADGQLRVIRKRFLYNDRQEIKHSPVFGPVWKPFCAFLNPLDATRLKLAGGDWVGLGRGGSVTHPGETKSQGGSQTHPYIELPVKLASWVQPSTVVINDLQHAQPANQLHGVAAVALRKLEQPQAFTTVQQAVTAGGGQ